MGDQLCETIVGENVPTARVDFAAALWDDILVIFGGAAPSSSLPIARLELLHLGTHCWTHGSTTGTLPSARIGLSMVVTVTERLLILFGGWDGTHYVSDVHVLDLQKWHWKRADIPGRGPSPRRDHVACACPVGMLIHGGISETGELSDLWLLHGQGPIENWWWECLGDDSDSPGARCKHAALCVGDGIVIAGGERGGVPLLDVHGFSTKSKCWHILPSLPYRIACQQSLILASCGIAIATQQNQTGASWALHYLPSYFLGSPIHQKSITKLTVVSEKHTKSNSYSWKASRPLSLKDVQDNASAGDTKASKALEIIAKLPEDKRPQARWAMLHRMANMSGCEQYTDPATGYMVFTAAFLRKRPCCGNGCRHCPYGHINVQKAGLERVAQDW